jgi:ribonuclease HI
MPLDPRAIHIYADGSCLQNPGGKGGATALVEYPDHFYCAIKQVVDFGCVETSNNRMELLACIKVLEWVRKNKPWPSVDRVQLIIDSQYVSENLSRAGYWQRDSWRNLHGEAKQNADLWKQLHSARSKAGIRVDFIWQRGKSSPILKDVDKLAKAAATKAMEVDHGFRGGKVSRSNVKGSAKIFPAAGQSTVIRPYRKNSPIKEENQIRFDLFSMETKQFDASYYAYASNEITAQLHRQHSYQVRFNNNPRNPRIEEIIAEIL